MELGASAGETATSLYCTTINTTTVAFENTNTSNIVSFMTIRFPGVGESESFILPEPEVYECMLRWCAKFYHVTVSDGTMTPETVVEGSFDGPSTS